MNIGKYLKGRQAIVDKELDRLLPESGEQPQIMHRAMRYVLKGGKRIRPILCLASAEATGGRAKDALRAACAIEIIHNYSLVHDDLPSMDDDDLRRGRLTCHKKFGVANAILAGDALLTLGFHILADATKDAKINTAIIRDLSRAAGTYGMIGGQAIDISPGEKTPLELEYINIHKTGALIAASCKIGATTSMSGDRHMTSLFQFGEYIGLAFQVVDNILDGEGMTEAYGPRRAYEHAKELIYKAKGRLSYLGKKAGYLNALADFILHRKY